MKKVLTALAILAVASVAQAELLATWTASSANNMDGATVAATGFGTTDYNFSMVGASGFAGGGTPSGATYAMGGANAASAAAAYTAAQYLYFTWNTGYTLDIDFADGRFTRSTVGGTTAQWGTIIGGTWTSIGSEISVTFTSTPSTSAPAPVTTTFTGVNGLESGQLALAFFGGSSSANTAWIRLDSRPSATPQVALTLDGTMTPIPEPATMSLLGLGALAMVLRRRMSK